MRLRSSSGSSLGRVIKMRSTFRALLLALVVSMIGFFAWAYLILHAADSGSFHEMSRIDAIYLAVTTLTTVGSGTLSPNDDAARALVAVNSLSSLFVIAVGVALLIGGLRSAASSR